jgi:hypothetical protein
MFKWDDTGDTSWPQITTPLIPLISRIAPVSAELERSKDRSLRSMEAATSKTQGLKELEGMPPHGCRGSSGSLRRGQRLALRQRSPSPSDNPWFSAVKWSRGEPSEFLQPEIVYAIRSSCARSSGARGGRRIAWALCPSNVAFRAAAHRLPRVFLPCSVLITVISPCPPE